MEILHELNQLDYGGVERVVANIIKFDKKNRHTVLSYKDGPFRAELEKVGAIVSIQDINGEIEGEADVIHIHSGGGVSHLAKVLGGAFCVVETIHSPVRSAVLNNHVSQRIGVSDVVSKINHNCETIYNGIDFNELKTTRLRSEVRRELGINENEIVVGRLGRLGTDKCLEEWLLTCRMLQKNRRYKFTPLIVGGEAANAKGYCGKLKLMAASLPVRNLVWTGHRSDVSNYYQVIDVFLYPSPTEGFGLVFIEALFNGCLAVTYDNDLNKEIIEGHALLSKREDGIKGLHDKVLKAIKFVRDNSKIKELRLLSQKHVMNRFQAKRMSEEYQRIYERCHSNFNFKSKSQAEHFLSS